MFTFQAIDACASPLFEGQHPSLSYHRVWRAASFRLYSLARFRDSLDRASRTAGAIRHGGYDGRMAISRKGAKSWAELGFSNWYS
jgi:hypothetical protein